MKKNFPPLTNLIDIRVTPKKLISLILLTTNFFKILTSEWCRSSRLKTSCIAYLFSMKLLLPHKVFLLRGNHETRDVNGKFSAAICACTYFFCSRTRVHTNLQRFRIYLKHSFRNPTGWEDHYGQRCFFWQCKDRFGDDVGYRVWNSINDAFDRMPLSAVIDQDIFCVHGGIPRPVTANSDGTYGSRVQDILDVPRVAGINPPLQFEDERHQQVASDCIWSDPASDDQELNSVDPDSGYGESLRGGGAICFGHKAVKDFLSQHSFSYIMVRIHCCFVCIFIFLSTNTKLTHTVFCTACARGPCRWCRCQQGGEGFHYLFYF